MTINKMSLTLRFSVWLVITSTAVLLMLSALDYAKESRRLSAELQSESDRIIERLAGNLPEPLFNVDYAQVSLIMNSEIKDPAVDQILVSERQGNTSKVKSSLYRQADGSVSDKTVQFVAENLLTRSQKLMHGNQEIGKVELGMSRLPMRAKLHTLVLSIGIRMVVTNAAILAAVFIMMKTLILRPLNAASDLLNRAAEHVLSSSEQVSGASQSQAEGSSEQAASIEEASSSLEEMASMTKRNAENAQKANDLAKQARLTADKGTENMQEMNSAMSEIQKSSDDIAKIIKTIDEIAFQTNILALNAAVEAARAGEAGMGFAVVADEVRNLAQRSAHAAKEISAKIEGAISKTAQGVGVSKHVTEALDNIVAQIRQVDELVSEVAGASREQTQGISQINLAIGEMDKVTQSNAANAEESAAAAQELNAQAVTMKESVNGLLKLVGGKTAVEMPAAEVHHGEPAVYRSVRQKTPVFPIPESADPWMRQ